VNNEFSEYIEECNICYPSKLSKEEKNRIKNTLHYQCWLLGKAEKELETELVRVWKKMISDIKRAFQWRE